MKATLNQNLPEKLFFSSLFLLFFLNLNGQSGLSFYSDAGRSNTSGGLYFNSAVIGSFRSGHYALNGGIQTDLDNNNHSVFSGLTFNLSRDFLLRDKRFSLESFFTRSWVSEYTGETNWGILLNAGHKHFKMKIGTNFRTYSFTDAAIREFKLDKSTTRCHEVYNFMYTFTYDVKTEDATWNGGITITDSDHFFINQENNVIFNIHGSYKLSPSASLFTEAWYEASGLTNLVVNNFGYFFRIGMTWNIN